MCACECESIPAYEHVSGLCQCKEGNVYKCVQMWKIKRQKQNGQIWHDE